MTATSLPTDAEDLKIITLARASRARSQASQGGCVRDTDGRTYAATNVALPPLRLSAIQVAVAMAVSSGAQGLEAVALVADVGPDDQDLATVRALAGTGVRVWWADPSGTVQRVVDV
jgi:cytidine deaminase